MRVELTVEIYTANVIIIVGSSRIKKINILSNKYHRFKVVKD